MTLLCKPTLAFLLLVFLDAIYKYITIGGILLHGGMPQWLTYVVSFAIAIEMFCRNQSTQFSWGFVSSIVIVPLLMVLQIAIFGI